MWGVVVSRNSHFYDSPESGQPTAAATIVARADVGIWIALRRRFGAPEIALEESVGGHADGSGLLQLGHDLEFLLLVLGVQQLVRGVVLLLLKLLLLLLLLLLPVVLGVVGLLLLPPPLGLGLRLAELIIFVLVRT